VVCACSTSLGVRKGIRSSRNGHAYSMKIPPAKKTLGVRVNNDRGSDRDVLGRIDNQYS